MVVKKQEQDHARRQNQHVVHKNLSIDIEDPNDKKEFKPQ